MRTLSTDAVASFWNELEKIADDPQRSTTDRALLAAPGVGAVAGAAAGYHAPHFLDPAAFGRGASDVRGKGRILAGVLGMGTGATLGWLPSVARDFGTAVMPQKTAGIAKLVPGGIPKITMPKPPSSSRLTAAADVVKPMQSTVKDIKVPSLGISAKAGTATNVQGLKAPSAIYG